MNPKETNHLTEEKRLKKKKNLIVGENDNLGKTSFERDPTASQKSQNRMTILTKTIGQIPRISIEEVPF